MTDDVAAPEPTPRKSRVVTTLRVLIRTRIMAGLAIVLPVWITILLVKFIFETMRDASKWVVEGVVSGHWVRFLPDRWQPDWTFPTEESLQSAGVQWGVGIFSVVLTVFILYAVGVFTANIVGRRIISMTEQLVDRVPMVKTVYRTSKQIFTMLGSTEEEKFMRAALVPFPDRASRAVGFITSIAKDAKTGEEICGVFVPTTPNPTSGFALVMRRADLIEVGWEMEDAVRLIMSAGMIIPPHTTMGPLDQKQPAAGASPRPDGGAS